MTEYTGMKGFAKKIAVPQGKFRRCKFASADISCYQKNNVFFPPGLVMVGTCMDAEFGASIKVKVLAGPSHTLSLAEPGEYTCDVWHNGTVSPPICETVVTWPEIRFRRLPFGSFFFGRRKVYPHLNFSG